MKTQQNPLTYTLLCLHYKTLAPLELPVFIGAFIRGKFGAALKNIQHCAGEAVECTACNYQAYCSYYQLFENKAPDNHPDLGKFSNLPRSYIFKTPLIYKSYYLQNDTFYFDLLLLGNAINYINDIISAAKNMGVNSGKDFKLELTSIQYLQDHKSAEAVFANDLKILSIDDASMDSKISKLEIKFLSPIKIKEKELEVSDLTLELLLERLVLRIELLSNIFCQTACPTTDKDLKITPINTAEIKCSTNLHHFHQKRIAYRNHQQTDIGGLLGSMFLEGDLQNIYPILKLGELLHIGKYASFGLGQYQLIEH